MELLAGSLNVEVDEFLHAGYLSAYPRSFAEMGSYNLERGTVEVIDVKKAVALKMPADEVDQVANTLTVQASSQPPPLTPASLSAGECFTVVVVFFFFACLVGQYYRRMGKVHLSAWRPWLLTATPVLLLVILWNGVFPGNQEGIIPS